MAVTPTPTARTTVTITGHQGNALAELRARTALRAAGLDPRVPLTRASSVTNEVWLTPTHVVRVNRGRDRRLAREARVAEVLPASVGYPRVHALGGRPGEDWLVLERVPGAPLARVWPRLGRRERQRAIVEVAHRLRALHDTPAPEDLPPVAGAPQLLEAGTGDATAPLRAALLDLAHRPHVEPLLVQEALELVAASADALEPFDSPTLVHGDLTFENVLWHEGEVTAILDVEWSRPSPLDVDLDIILRCCAHPQLHVAPDLEAVTRPEDYAEVPTWLADAYPRLFSSPRALERLRLFALAYEVRSLVADPPRLPVDRLDPLHAYHRFARLVRGESYLDP